MGLGAQGEGQVERVNGGSVLGQSQMTQLRVVAQEVGEAQNRLQAGVVEAEVHKLLVELQDLQAVKVL